jgi:hypothetical protein
LTGLLGRDVQGLAATPPLAATAAPMFRAADDDAEIPAGALPMSLVAKPEPDEVDRLFGVGQSH